MKNKGIIIIFTIVIILLAVFLYLFATNKISFSNKNESNSKNTEQKDTLDVKVLYTYTSGDNNALKGNPEVLTIYSMSDTKIEFKYHAVWNEKDIEGIAKKVDKNNYIYELNDYKIQLNINDDSAEVKEYMNEQLNSTTKLFK